MRLRRLKTYIDPTTTNQLLNNFSLAIDDAKLVIKLGQLNEQVNKIESSDDRTDCSECLREEITMQKVQLNYIRD